MKWVSRLNVLAIALGRCEFRPDQEAFAAPDGLLIEGTLKSMIPHSTLGALPRFWLSLEQSPAHVHSPMRTGVSYPARWMRNLLIFRNVWRSSALENARIRRDAAMYLSQMAPVGKTCRMPCQH